MPLYLGIPVYICEAARLFGKKVCDMDDTHDILHYIETRMKYMKMDLHYTDKGQYIIGYEIQTSAATAEVANMKSVEHFMIQLCTLKELFKREIRPYYDNFRKVEVSPMDGETKTVSFPEPYIIDG
jgi:hypothetical protein